MDRNGEIIQIKRELDVLRERYASYERSARRLRIVLWVWLPLVIVLILAAIGKVLADALMAIFFAGMVVVVILFFWLLGRLDPRNIRWIDVASATHLPFPQSGQGSDARLIEEQIAERERRLMDLGSTKET